MKLYSGVLLNLLAVAAMPSLANAAGTYYTGAAYQPTQYRYGQSGTYATSGYGRASAGQPQVQNVRYNNYQQAQNTTTQTRSAAQSQSSQQQGGTSRKGFFARAGITHENAMWKFNMKEAGSMLHYDNVAWNVLDLNGGYIFDLGKAKMQVDAGFKYGMQWGKSSMIDDDITNGGYDVTVWKADGQIIGKQIGHSLSVGTSQNGNMMGFNVGVGLTDFLKFGNLKITPSIGYRYLKYKLDTKNNYALSVDTSTIAGGCFVNSSGQQECDPVYIFYNSDGDKVVVTRDHINGTSQGTGDDVPVPNGFPYVFSGGTAYYEQPGTSHSYNVAWSGPYVALDMLYDINQNNSVNGRVEFGMPGYTATGDQPYRWDWAHPKSVEDKANMFSALHFGFGANWKTAISGSVSFTLGLTYDYYSVKGADATTYLNQGWYNQLLAQYNNDESALLDPTTGNPYAIELNKSRNECGGWVCSASKEVDSVYKSIGIRAGIDAQF